MRTVKVVTFGLLLSLLTLSEAQSGCNYFENLVPGKLYQVYNKEYPNQYRGRQQCTWRAMSPYAIKLNCNLEMPSGNNCMGDYLGIQYNGREMKKYCGYGTFETKGENVTITFNSQYYTQGGRFRCEMQVDKFDEYDCQCGWKNPTYIVGGKETGVNEFPMMAGLIDGKNRELYCGATIISNKHVLTAAHCVTNRDVVNEIGVVVGEHDTNTGRDTPATKLHRINKCWIHSQYRDIHNDIAVCETVDKIEYSPRIGPVCLPFQHRRDSFIGSYVTLLGWGLTDFGGAKSNVLQATDVNVISNYQCAKYYSPGKQIIGSNMCTYTPGKDSCQMDSGGPALWQNPSTHKLVIAGITSAGIGCDSGAPGIYTRVGDYIEWIMSVTPGVQYCKME